MRTRGTLLAGVVVAVAVGLVAMPVLGAVGSTGPASGGVSAVQANGTNDSTTSNVSLGAQISSFMQANSAETESSVESGMWEAEYNQSDGERRPALVQSRIDRLERRSDRLRDRMSRLQAKYENGTIPPVAYRAQASRLTAELDGLSEAINGTSDRARTVGVNASRLDTLRNRAQNMSRREVAAVARDLSVGPPDHAGPPGDAGPPDDRGPERPGSHGDAGPPDDRGPERPGSPGNAGPPDDRGPKRPDSPGDAGPPENVTGNDRPGRPTDADPADPSDPADPDDPSDPADANDSDDADDPADASDPADPEGGSDSDAGDGSSGGPSGGPSGPGGGGPPGRN